MAKNARAVVAASLVAMLSILVVLSGYPLVGAGVFALGMIGLAAVRERDAREGMGDDAQAKLDRAMEDQGPAGGPAPATPPTALPPRTGGLGLPTWQPTARPTVPTEPDFGPDFGPSADAPTAFAPEPRVQPQPTPPPASEPSTGSSWDAWQEADRGPVAPEYDNHNPLAGLDRLDEIDPVAEVERLDRLGPAAPPATAQSTGVFSFSSAPAPINEAAVQTDDDIMAASQATELQIDNGAESELARLLAKVQQRLAAYE